MKHTQCQSLTKVLCHGSVREYPDFEDDIDFYEPSLVERLYCSYFNIKLA